MNSLKVKYIFQLNNYKEGEKVETLIVVDVQKGLFEQKTPVYNEETLIQNINKVIKYTRKKQIPIIFIQHANKGILKYQSDEWQLHPSIQPLKEEIIIHKQHGSAFKETHLNEILKKQKVQKLIILGLTTHGCVKATCHDALKFGYETILIEDAHSSFSEKAEELIKTWNHKLSEKGITLYKTEEFTKKIN